MKANIELFVEYSENPHPLGSYKKEEEEIKYPELPSSGHCIISKFFLPTFFIKTKTLP